MNRILNHLPTAIAYGVEQINDSVCLPASLHRVRRVGAARSSAEAFEMAMEYRGFGRFRRVTPLQLRSEICPLLDLLVEEKVRRACEIGSFLGGTLFMMTRLLPAGSEIFSIDWPEAEEGLVFPRSRKALHEGFARDGQRLEVIFGDSRDPQIADELDHRLAGEPLDFLFIDGDHSIEGVTADFARYAPMVRPGGLIAFHDIVDHDRRDFGVSHCWRRLITRYRSLEFVGPGVRERRRGNGVGVLWWDGADRIPGTFCRTSGQPHANVQILLSTFNGQRYLEPLVESLFNQDLVPSEILVRDDGSTDRTKELLAGMAADHRRIRVVHGNHVGYLRSFFELIKLSSPESEFVALCDQDDVWKPDKLRRAVSQLQKNPNTTPALYSSRLAVVDKDLRHILFSPLPRRELSFQNALVDSRVWGCTTVFNRAARDLLARELPKQNLSHDWWIYLVVAAFGEVIFDEKPTILHRRHDHNVSKFPTSGRDLLFGRMRWFRQHNLTRHYSQRAREFERIFGDRLGEENQITLSRFLDATSGPFVRRLRYAFSNDLYKQNPSEHLTLKLLLLLNAL